MTTVRTIVTFPLALAAVVAAEAEARQLDARHGHRDHVAALAADHLAAGDVALEVLLDVPADDVREARAVPLDPTHRPTGRGHDPASSSSCGVLVSPRANRPDTWSSTRPAQLSQ